MDVPGIRAALGLTLLCLALVLLVPPFGGPDEADHHTRIQGVAEGTYVGPQGEPPSTGLTPLQRPWVRQTTRIVPVAGGRSSAGGFGCFSVAATVGAACLDGVQPADPREHLEATPVGTYELLPYLLPAAVAHVAASPAGADRWERLATLAPALALLLAALWLVAPVPVLVAALLLAASPATLTVAAGLGGSGLEVCAGIAVVCALVTPAVIPRRGGAALALLAVAAPLLVLARALGPVWLLVLALVALPHAATWLPARAPNIRRTPAGGGRMDVRLLGGAVLTAVAVGVQRAWESTYGAAPPRYGIPPALESLRAGVRRLPDTLREGVGADGYLHLLAPWPLAILWLGAVAGLVALAAACGPTWRARVHPLAVTAAALAAAPVLFAVVTRYTGFGVQGRHVLPLLAAVPLVAATTLARGGSVRAGTAATWFATAAPVLVGVVQLALALVLAHRYAVGTDGPWLFVGRGWSPPGGWLPTLALVLAGAALVASAGVDAAAVRSRRAAARAVRAPPAAR